MKRLIATPDGAGLQSHNPHFRSILVNLATPATREHERIADKYNGQRVRLSGWSHRRMVREQVSRTDSAAIAMWPHSIY